MEVFSSTMSHNPHISIQTVNAAEAEAMDMDIDMDLNIGMIDDEDQMQTAINDPTAASRPSSTPQPAGSTDDLIVVPNKVHLRGLDDFTTGDIKSFCSEHTLSKMEHLEWINDTAANVVYCDETTASGVLLALTIQNAEKYAPTQLRPAKPFSARPSSLLHVRLAAKSDRKQPKAYETSRFYLLHPEHDPRENGSLRKRRSSNHNDQQFRRRHYNKEEDNRRKKIDLDNGFDASMYDDNLSAEAGLSPSPDQHSKKFLGSYRPGRDRSASPRSNRRQWDRSQRSRSPLREKVSQARGRLVNNRDKELLPSKALKAAKERDLFSEELLQSTKKHKTELFPNKTLLSNHRRTDAIDTATDTADLFASKMSVPFTDGPSDSRNLADRITRPSKSGDAMPKSTSSRDQGEGYNIKGNSSQGIAIKGGATARELFPGKANVGKELFSEKLKGRGASRKKAEDFLS